jgi:hypothetical protein
MVRNEGTVDRIIRAIIGVVALVASVAAGVGTVGGIVLLVLGGVLVVTAAVGFCPLYRVFGITTCPVDK